MAENEEKPQETTAEPLPPKKHKKNRKRWIIPIVIVAAAAGIIFFINRNKTDIIPQNQYVTEEAQEREIIKTLTGNGSLQPADSYTVTTLVSGEILTADFEEGDIVEKDSVLYELDSSDVSNNIERAQLSVNQASRNYSSVADRQYIKSNATGIIFSLDVKAGDNITAGQQIAVIRDSDVMTLKVPFPSDDAARFTPGMAATVTLDSTFETLNGTVKEVSGADIVSAGNMITRNVTIEVKNPGGLSSTQSASASVNGIGCASAGTFSYNAESTVFATASGTVSGLSVKEGDKITKDAVILTLGGTDITDQLQNASENLRSAQLSMESTRDQLDNYTITSPIGGTIVTKNYKAGDKAEMGKQLCVIYDLSYLEITMYVDELDISDIKVGQSVTVTADAVQGREYVGTVTKVSVAGVTSGGTTSYPVTVRIDKTSGLLPGMNVDAEVMVAKESKALSIPNAALQRGNVVMITADSPSASKSNSREAPEGYVYVDVETGISDDKYVQILSGLQPGDTIAYTSTFVSSNIMDMMMSMQEGEMPPEGAGPNGGFQG